jgi:predicted RNase H-like nuclease (RuvC/YqgF family)
MVDDRESREVRDAREFKQSGDDFRYSSLLREISNLDKKLDGMETRFINLVREIEARFDRRIDELERRSQEGTKSRELLEKALNDQEKKFIALDKELKPIKTMAYLVSSLVVAAIVTALMAVIIRKGV